jgi:2',3'-cyclic-nucleotide 2'-phosphodiesterase
MQIKLLCIGDVVGRPGRQVLADHLPALIKQRQIDGVIANGENTSGGSGLTLQACDKLLKYGIDMITLGDHVYRKREIIEAMQTHGPIVRPANLSPQAAGPEWSQFTTRSGIPVAVFSLMGRMYMPLPTDNPFHAANRVLSKIPSDIKVIVVDMHAEASSEKIAMGWFLDGRVSFVFGTHTHIPTADETILPQGTAYISDLGMTGPHKSVLGRNIEPVLKSLLTQMPYSYSIATEDLRLNAAIVVIDSISGKSLSIERLCVKSEAKAESAYDQTDGKGMEYHNDLP